MKIHQRSFSSLNVGKLNHRLTRETDPELFKYFELEKVRQKNTVILIASENYVPRIVADVLGSHLSNKYSEGYPGARYYAGNEHIDKIERLCQKRALEAFGLNEKEWNVNVQSLSGTPANFQTYAALIKPHDRIMGLDLPHGGHLSHGFFTPKKKISATSIFFESMPYRLDEKTGLINYDELLKNALLFRPQLIIAGTSAYSRLIDYKKFREICDSTSSILMADMAHISGLVAGRQIPSPFDYADVVTTTTHKSLRGPRGAMIFSRKSDKLTGKPTDWGEKIDFSVFPMLQGGPHNHTIAALAAALKLCNTEEYRLYQKQVILNSKSFAKTLLNLGYKIVSNGTDNHLVLIDVKSTFKEVDGARAERVLELISLITNKNTVPHDTSALVPSGIRIGTPAFTTRGATEQDFDKIAGFFHRAILFASKNLTAEIVGGKKLSDFKNYLNVKNDQEFKSKFPELAKLRSEVELFASSFPTIGYEKNEMEFKDEIFTI